MYDAYIVHFILLRAWQITENLCLCFTKEMHIHLWIHIYQSSLYTIYWTSDDSQFDKRSYDTLEILRIFQLWFYSRIEFNIYINRFTLTLCSKRLVSSPMIFTSVHENANSVQDTHTHKKTIWNRITFSSEVHCLKVSVA